MSESLERATARSRVTRAVECNAIPRVTRPPIGPRPRVVTNGRVLVREWFSTRETQPVLSDDGVVHHRLGKCASMVTNGSIFLDWPWSLLLLFEGAPIKFGLRSPDAIGEFA